MPMRTGNSKLCLSVKTPKIGWNVPIPADRDIIIYVSCYSVIFLQDKIKEWFDPGQDKQEPLYLYIYRWHFAVAWDSLQEESCPVSAQICDDSTGPSLIL